MAFPRADLTVSSWAASASGAFPLSADSALRMLRDFNRMLPALILPCMAAILVLQTFRPRPWLLRPHKAIFLLTFYMLGPGLLIQVLKLLVGRARPYEIVEFGGQLPFTPTWQVSDACARSCSFASGESASAIALLALALLVPVRWRKIAIAALVPAVVVFSLNRIAFGAHFLSDVVLAWFLMLWVMLWLWQVFHENGERIDAALRRRACRLRS
ncbi:MULTISPECIES: phosphatase PAP2 family protein [unclassified Sinorhizobium]|uniref:phosphatase PAP2 family protein n=1 Tax=unclassified Sinorhizobium TaxID=2613772 RepID=UPI0035238BE6